MSQCAGSASCFTAFHPLCARAAGYPVATVDADEGDGETADGSGGGGSGDKTRREGSTGDSDRENRDANAAGVLSAGHFCPGLAAACAASAALISGDLDLPVSWETTSVQEGCKSLRLCCVKLIQ